jgi:septal ring factor EnvC (AmiA/AmiB activator)
MGSRFCGCLLILAAFSAFTSPPFAQGQGNARQGAKYHLALGRTYTQHAGSNVRLLKRVAMAGPTVPADVVAENVGMARVNVQAAKKSFARLGSAAAENAQLAKQVAQLQQQLDKVSQQLIEFEAQTTQKEVESGKILARTAALNEQLRAADAAAQQTDNQYYGADSSSYYSDHGGGPFVD